ncbi:MAG TPA: HEPN domain-containing protein [Egibacteraceae bacterium]|nr:HEPN domain-containing protein [Egibacteraceae bacterium]
MLDEEEFDRWIRAAEDELEAGRVHTAARIHNSAVLHAELAVRLALRALLRGVGVTVRSHALDGLADLCAEHAGLDVGSSLRDELTALGRDYHPTRYPDAVPEGTPRSNYTSADAERSLDLAARVATLVRGAGAALRQEAEALLDETMTRRGDGDGYAPRGHRPPSSPPARAHRPCPAVRRLT